jgi:hypothetical protein
MIGNKYRKLGLRGENKEYVGAWPNVIDLRNILVGEITKMKESH